MSRGIVSESVVIPFPGTGCQSFRQVILKVYLSNSNDTGVDVPITPETTCRDVIECCRQPGEEQCHLAELWRGCERPIGDEEKPYEILQQWGIHREEVKFFLRHENAIPLGNVNPGRRNKKRNGVNEIDETEDLRLPAGVDLTLTDLQEMATRQQQQIESQQQMLVAKEQRLKFLKQQEKKHQQMAAENERLRKLREKVESQEQKLRKLRAIRGQVDTHKNNNSSLTSELETIRQLFNEKEKELALAVAKVEELSDQLELLRKGKVNGLNGDNTHNSPTAAEIERLRKELLIRNKLNEQQSSKLQAQQQIISERSDNMGIMDKRIEELTERLRKKRAQQKIHQQQKQQQQPPQQQQQPLQPQHQQQHSFHGMIGNSLANGMVTLPRAPSSRPTNIAAVEPYSIQAPNKSNKGDPAKETYSIPLKPKLVEVDKEKPEELKKETEIKSVSNGKVEDKMPKNDLLCNDSSGRTQISSHSPPPKGLATTVAPPTVDLMQQNNVESGIPGIRGQPEGNTESSSDTASVTDNSSVDNGPVYHQNSKPNNSSKNRTSNSKLNNNNDIGKQPATTTYVAPYSQAGTVNSNVQSVAPTTTKPSQPPQTLPKPHPAMQTQHKRSPQLQRSADAMTNKGGKPKPPVPMKPTNLPLNNDQNRKPNGQTKPTVMPDQPLQRHPPSPGAPGDSREEAIHRHQLCRRSLHPQCGPTQQQKPPSPVSSRAQPMSPSNPASAQHRLAQHPPSPHMVNQVQHPSSPVWQKRPPPEVPPKSSSANVAATITVPPDSVQKNGQGKSEVLTYRPPTASQQQGSAPSVFPKPQVSQNQKRDIPSPTQGPETNKGAESTAQGNVTAVNDALSILRGNGDPTVRTTQTYQRYVPTKPTASTTFTTITPPVESYQRPPTTVANAPRSPPLPHTPTTTVTTARPPSTPNIPTTTMASVRPFSPPASRPATTQGNSTTATATVKPMNQAAEPIYDVLPKSQPIHPAYRDHPPPHYTQATSRPPFQPPPPHPAVQSAGNNVPTQPGNHQQGKQIPLQSQYLFPNVPKSQPNSSGQNSPPYEASNDPNRRPPSPVKYFSQKFPPGYPPLKHWDNDRLRNIPRPLRRRHSYTEEKEAMPMVRPPGINRDRIVSESDGLPFYQPDRPPTTFNNAANMDIVRRTFYQQQPPQQPPLQQQQLQPQQPSQNNHSPVPAQQNNYPSYYPVHSPNGYRTEIRQQNMYDSLEPSPQQYREALSQVARSSAMESLQIRQHYSAQPKKSNLKKPNGTRKTRRVSFDPLALLLDASLEGEFNMVRKVIGEVTNPSGSNDEGITALHNAICAGHYDIVTFLIDYGCDVNAQDSDGWTPLHCAASCNNLAMVKFLVERGACLFATTISDVETPAEKCEEDEEGFDGCSEYLYGIQEKLGIMNKGVVYAVYDYEAESHDELSFKDGDAMVILRRGDENEREWWWARKGNREGYVPRNLLGMFPRVKSRRD
ncbi:LOW QUALITY PROTEIN: apoptosis-stimulating of p53 protein 1-like [Ptychodera flava]|uniref:LOW QUALITY PROTEIN: apoptosis-stimulating of p53 protein 1-like n=1 Tax=Ptychodera flava TaxID=63121 RepID=UPI00396A4F39